MSESSISERIKERRKELRIRQQELADQVGVSLVTVTRWENPKSGRIPNAFVLPKLAQALKTTPDYLLSGTKDIPTDNIDLQVTKNEGMATISLGGDKNITVPANAEGYAFLKEALLIAMSPQVTTAGVTA